jgi:hypothetical protein
VRVAAPLYYEIVMSNRNDSGFRPPNAHVPQESASIALDSLRFAMISLRCASLGKCPHVSTTFPALPAIFAKFQLFCATTPCAEPVFSGGFSQPPELAVHQHKSTCYVHYIRLWDPAKHHPLSRIVLATHPNRGFFVDRVREQAESDQK